MSTCPRICTRLKIAIAGMLTRHISQKYLGLIDLAVALGFSSGSVLACLLSCIREAAARIWKIGRSGWMNRNSLCDIRERIAIVHMQTFRAVLIALGQSDLVQDR